MAKSKDQFTEDREMEAFDAFKRKSSSVRPGNRLLPLLKQGTRSEIRDFVSWILKNPEAISLQDPEGVDALDYYALATRFAALATEIKDQLGDAPLDAVEEEGRAMGITFKVFSRTTWVYQDEVIDEAKSLIKQRENLAQAAAKNPFSPVFDKDGVQIPAAERRVKPYLRPEF